jgi:type IV conjugative transfer system protein TraL
MQKKRFPQYLSSPFQVLWFETDELVIVVVFLIFALIFGYLFWLLLFVGPYLYTRLKKKYPRGFLRHVLYFIGLIRIKGYPSYFEKEFFE